MNQDPPRPGFPQASAVLQALTVAPWPPRWPQRTLGSPSAAEGEGIRWVTEDPAEAYELLSTRGLIPPEWVGAPNRQFYRPPSEPGGCSQCRGRVGGQPGAVTRCTCSTQHYPPHPFTVAEAAAWACLGPGAILRAEELATEAVLKANRRGWGRYEAAVLTWEVGSGRHPNGHYPRAFVIPEDTAGPMMTVTVRGEVDSPVNGFG